MKKSLFLGLAVLAMTLGFTSCQKVVKESETTELEVVNDTLVTLDEVDAKSTLDLEVETDTLQ